MRPFGPKIAEATMQKNRVQILTTASNHEQVLSQARSLLQRMLRVNGSPAPIASMVQALPRGVAITFNPGVIDALGANLSPEELLRAALSAP